MSAYDCGSDSDSDLSSLGFSPPPPSPRASPLPCTSYPSPSATQDSEDEPTLPLSRKRSFASRGDGSAGGTPKKRKFDPNNRTTLHLDLTEHGEEELEDHIEELNLMLKTLRKCRKIVVIAGAGISVSAGIPDFRSDDGLFNRLKKQHNLKASGKEMFDASVYRNDASTSSFHDMIRSLAEHSSKAQPTAFHHLLARLAKEKRLLRLYTQNVDEIDTSMPPLETSIPLGPKGPWPKTIQLHGGLRKMVCQKCRHIADLECDLFKGPVPPLCPTCAEVDDVRQASGQRSHGVGRLRPRMVLYNEHNPDDEAIGSVMMADLRARPDAVIVVGTSLKIPGVKRFLKECVGVVRSRRNGISMWINRDPVPTEKNFDDCWDLVVKADCDEVARRAALKRWDDESDEIFDCTSSDVEQAKARGQVSVVVTPRKQLTSKLPFNEKTGMMTPSSQDERSGSTQRKLNFGPATQKEAREDLLLKTAAILTSASNAKPQSKATLPKKKPATTTKKATAPTKRKPAIKKRDTTTKETTAKISNRFTVSKSTNKSTTSKSASNISVEITGVKHAANSGAASPMSHISPTDARSNGPVKEEDDETLVWKEGKEKRVVSPMDLRQMLN